MEMQQIIEVEITEILEEYKAKDFQLDRFLSQVSDFFIKHPQLNQKPFPMVHSVKSRKKDCDHLKDKIMRKYKEGKTITKDNLFEKITDLIGVRVFHLHQEQFRIIHEVIQQNIAEGEWVYVEAPKAYTWDPESKKFYEKLGIPTELRDTLYTSVHYVVKLNNPSAFVACEIQVRTLFEEIWGEIDHAINYPYPTESIACKEQLKVLTKLTSTGTRLADSIFRSHQEYLNTMKKQTSQ